MARFKKDTPRLDVRVLDGDNRKNVIFEVTNRNHLDIGELFTDTYMSSLITQHCNSNNIPIPDNALVLVTAEFKKI